MSATKKEFFLQSEKLELWIVAEEWAKQANTYASVIQQQLREFITRKRLGFPENGFMPMLCSETAFVEKQDIEDFCRTTGFELPGFWFPLNNKRSVVGSSKAEKDCEKWFIEFAMRVQKPASKSKLKEEAVQRFPGLSERAFKRIWESHAPHDWKASGAPKKNHDTIIGAPK